MQPVCGSKSFGCCFVYVRSAARGFRAAAMCLRVEGPLRCINLLLQEIRCASKPDYFHEWFALKEAEYIHCMLVKLYLGSLVMKPGQNEGRSVRWRASCRVKV